SYPKERAIVLLSLCFLPCYLLNRHLCGGIFLSTHTVPVGLCTSGSCQGRDAGRRCCSAQQLLLPALGDSPLCSSNHCQ
ncbi:GC-rich promoter binding protein 1-like 1, isoform CRA_b, partial [Mus musculus]